MRRRVQKFASTSKRRPLSRQQHRELSSTLRGERIPTHRNSEPSSLGDSCQQCNGRPDPIPFGNQRDLATMFDHEGRRRTELLHCSCGTVFCSSCVMEQLIDVSKYEFQFRWITPIFDNTIPGGDGGLHAYGGSFLFEVARWVSRTCTCLSCCIKALESSNVRCDIIYGEGRRGRCGTRWVRGRGRYDPVLGPILGKQRSNKSNDFDRLVNVWVDRLEQQRETRTQS
jgi:hypothetical protein